MALYSSCSVEIAAQFVEKEVMRSGDSVSRITIFTQLLVLFMDSMNQKKMEKIDQLNHFHNFQKKTADRASHQFKDACNFPDQLELIKQSAKDEQLAADIAGKLGITLDSYRVLCDEALIHNEQLEQRKAVRYRFSEIGSASSGAIKKSDNVERVKKQQVKIKAII